MLCVFLFVSFQEKRKVAPYLQLQTSSVGLTKPGGGKGLRSDLQSDVLRDRDSIGGRDGIPTPIGVTDARFCGHKSDLGQD
ncbi:hypothetical protein Hdeb2414_s0023g00637851 [Helianthus debilis subsp. tardiflorus]